MSTLLGLIAQSLDSSKISQIGQAVGASPEQTKSALSAALPMLVGALSKNASATGGGEALAGALDRDHDGTVLDTLGSLLGGSQQAQSQGGGLLGMLGSLVTDAPGPGSTRSANGDGILGHMLGAKRGAVEQGVSQSSGLNGGQAAQLMALAAPMVMGALGRAKQQQGLDAGGITDLLKQEAGQLGGSALGSALDSDDDSSVAADVAKIGAQLAGSGILSSLFG